MLSISDLCVSFYTPVGEVKALNGVCLAVDKGEVLGVVGESGSGKSVTFSVVSGLLQKPGEVKSGSVIFDGRDMIAAPEKVMRDIRGKDISVIFQDSMTSLNPVFTIGDQLMEMILLHMDMDKKEARTHAIKMLALVGISNPETRMRQYPHELSGGMRQRVMIAMALSCKPKLLIADEPTTALDVTIQAQILDLINKMRTESGTAIVLITHDLGVVSEICDRVAVMYAGMVMEYGTVDEIFYQSAHPYTKGLLSCLPRLDEKKSETLEAIDGVPVDLLLLPEGCPFVSRCKYAMKICLRELPPVFEVSENHTSICWLCANTRTEPEVAE
ncbi:MAG: ABC transporter ATP-binding protein [Oscillospiraceae bacterium]|nr:ABC transporter ATP-binding protein [Oscillospiraceae bacterium]